MPSAADEFTEAYRANYGDLLRFVRRRVDPGDADEIVAEVFTIAWRRWSDAPEDVRPWFFGIAYNVLSQSQRTWRRQRALELRVAGEPSRPSSTPLGAADDAIDLKAAWGRLDSRDREVIALVAWDGLTGDEAAQVLGCSRATFAARLSRARRRFAAQVSRGHPPGPASDMRSPADHAITHRAPVSQPLPTMQGEIR